MKKKTILNICMVLTIILVAVCGVMAVGYVKGWFNQESASDLIVSEKTGIAMIERNGVAYEVGADTAIKVEDRLYTKTAAGLTIAKADVPAIYLGANAELSVAEMKKSLKLEVQKGEALIDVRNIENVTVISGNTEIVMNQAVATISTQAGSSMIYVYAGEVALGSENAGEAINVASGNVVTIVEGAANYKTMALKVNALNDAQMAQLKTCGMDETFCFTEEELDKVQAEREAEILKAQQEALRQKEEAKKKAEEEAKKANSKATDTKETNAVVTDTETEVTNDVVTEDYDVGEDYEEDYEEDIYEEDDTESDTATMSCTIKIVCDTILNNMENLTPGKEGYVPSSGTILGTTSVSFSEGETVFEVLQRACNSAGIQLEYSWTPLYDSYYIEGINHLYEFDCGSESGWMYKVNGWFPNYGCSSYYLEDGDTIVWCYTCNGLGADVGGSV